MLIRSYIPYRSLTRFRRYTVKAPHIASPLPSGEGIANYKTLQYSEGGGIAPSALRPPGHKSRYTDICLNDNAVYRDRYREGLGQIKFSVDMLSYDLENFIGIGEFPFIEHHCSAVD